jgi:hypothetical protein
MANAECGLRNKNNCGALISECGTIPISECGLKIAKYSEIRIPNSEMLEEG